LGDAESSLGDVKSSLGDVKSSLGDAKSSLGDAKSSLGDANISLGDPVNSFEDVRTRQQRLDSKLAVGGVGASLSGDKRAAALAASVATNRKYALLLHRAVRAPPIP
jgi:hypothetical protein